MVQLEAQQLKAVRKGFLSGTFSLFIINTNSSPNSSFPTFPTNVAHPPSHTCEIALGVLKNSGGSHWSIFHSDSSSTCPGPFGYRTSQLWVQTLCVHQRSSKSKSSGYGSLFLALIVAFSTWIFLERLVFFGGGGIVVEDEEDEVGFFFLPRRMGSGESKAPLLKVDAIF
ncbi:hypothetical protein FCV25MIE_33962 [Fagus crenata]